MLSKRTPARIITTSKCRRSSGRHAVSGRSVMARGRSRAGVGVATARAVSRECAEKPSESTAVSD